MIKRSAEVAETFGRRQLNVVAIQEVCYRNEAVKRGEFEYMLYSSGDEKAYGGVGLIVRHDLAKFVMAIRRVSPKIISMDIVLSGKVMSLISVYAP